MTFSKRTLSIVTVILVIALLGGGIYWRLRPEGTAGADEASETRAARLPEVSAGQQFATDVPQPVTGAAVVRDTLWLSVTAAGQAEAIREARVTALVEGVVLEVPVRENNRVSGGQTLLQIDTAEYALAAAQARADLLKADAEFRQMILFNEEIEDPEVREQRERLARSRSGLDQAEVGLRRAEMDLERTRVRAPFAGRIADLEVVPGEYVTQGTQLTSVVDLDPVKVEVQVLEAEVGYLAEGRRASITFAAFPGESFTGRIETINPVVDPETRTGRVTIHLSNPDHRIKPGMYARVSLDAQSFPDRILAPRAAILERDRRTMLFVYNGDDRQGQAEWRYVCTGLESDALVEIVACDEGTVEPGETVLVDGHHYLVHQATVRLVQNPEAEGGRPGR